MKRITLLTLLLLVYSAVSSAATCPNGTAASYDSTFCQQSPVHLGFPDGFASISTSGPGMPTITNSQITFRLDPQGSHTILIATPVLRNLKKGQVFDATFEVFAKDSVAVSPWLHGIKGGNSHCTGSISATQTVDTIPATVTTATCADGNKPKSFSANGWVHTTINLHAVGPAQMQSLGVHF